MLTLAGPCRHEQEVKRSRFIARAAPVASPEEALAFLGQVREPQATHNCWAYKLGAEYRFSDDGEPGGTAGRPILGAIERVELENVMVVVTRYFGGIKLGAGGLARAYGGVASSCLSRAPKKPMVELVEVRIEAPFDAVGHVYGILSQHFHEKLEEQYSDSGLRLLLRLDATDCQQIRKALLDASRGTVKLDLLPRGLSPER